jgi:uncharacterized protein (TIGR02452 family)
MLVSIMIGTQNAIEMFQYKCEDGTEVNLDLEDLSGSLFSIIFSNHEIGHFTHLYDNNHRYNFPRVTNAPASVEIFCNDCNEVGFYLMNQGYNPVVLNMASTTSPGGGYKYGHWAQEESLFRRSNYYLSLDNPDVKYPLPEFGGAYTARVLVSHYIGELVDHRVSRFL